MDYWLNFCDLRELSYKDLNTTTASDFIAFLYDYCPDMTGKTAGSTLTAVTSLLLKKERVEWTRNKYISDLLKGFRVKRPVAEHPKMPWSVYHSYYMMKHCVKRSNLVMFAKGIAMLWGNIGLLRPNEIAYGSTKKTILRKDVEFHPSFNRPTDIIITIHGRKNEEDPNKNIEITMGCHCSTPFGGKSSHLICPVHRAREYCIAADKKHGSDPNRPSFCAGINKSNILTYSRSQIQRWVKNVFDKLNDKLNIKLD
eukprot:431073_1